VNLKDLKFSFPVHLTTWLQQHWSTAGKTPKFIGLKYRARYNSAMTQVQKPLKPLFVG
jgi:hypothetical protein